MSERFSSTFSPPRALVAMAHLAALPGSPRYDAEAGIRGAIDAARSA